MKRLIITIFAVLAVMLAACERVEKHTETCKVLSIDKQVETSGNEDGFSTVIYWIVVTDKGTYHLRTAGLWACADTVGKLKVDSVYDITVDGWFASPFLGAYPHIVKVESHQDKGGVD